MNNIKKFLFWAIIILSVFSLIFTMFLSYYRIYDYNIITKYAGMYELEPEFVCAVIHAESKFEKNAKSSADANGYMQIVQQTADWAAEEIGIIDYDYSRIHEPEINIQIGSWYLRNLIDQFGDVKTALCAYNAGSGTVSEWLENDTLTKNGELINIPYKETEQYIKRVEINYYVYKFLFKYVY